MSRHSAWHRAYDKRFRHFGGQSSYDQHQLDCFPICNDRFWEECENRAWAGDWMLQLLVPLNAAYVRNVQLSEFFVDDWHHVGVNDTYFASILEVGDNFMIKHMI